MIPYDIDPSLHQGKPAPARLDDGFEPPRPEDVAALAEGQPQAPAAVTQEAKSDF